MHSGGYLPGSEGSVEDITDSDNVETSQVPLGVDDNSNASHVPSSDRHGEVSGFELGEVDNLVLHEVELDGVVDLDGRVGVTDGAAVVRDEEGDTLGTELHLLDLEELVGSLLGGDAVDGESTLDVVEETEVLARLLNGDDVWEVEGGGEGEEKRTSAGCPESSSPSCPAPPQPSPSNPSHSTTASPRSERVLTHETSGVGLVSSDLVVDSDEPLLDDEGDLTSGERVLETVAEEDLAEHSRSARQFRQHLPVIPPPSCNSPPFSLHLRNPMDVHLLDHPVHSPPTQHHMQTPTCLSGPPKSPQKSTAGREGDVPSRGGTRGACGVQEKGGERRFLRAWRASTISPIVHQHLVSRGPGSTSQRESTDARGACQSLQMFLL
jgi:hypothetical protein